jgi:ABC-type cobalamin/Fe3+-siderophores transport system ATPase subunit
VSLRLDHLSVDIAGQRIITDVSLTADDGQFTGLLGPNGSGKSTILKTVYRVHKAAAGRLLLDGTDLLALSARDAARRIAVVAQETTSEFDFTVREMVMIGEEPLLPAAELRRGHPQPRQCRGGHGHRPVAASVGIRPARRRLLTPARRRQPLAGTVSG